MFQGKRGGYWSLVPDIELSLAASYRSESEPCKELYDLGLKALWAHHRSNEGHHVEEEADPAGGHLDPEHRPATVQQLFNLMVVIAARQACSKIAEQRRTVVVLVDELEFLISSWLLKNDD